MGEDGIQGGEVVRRKLIKQWLQLRIGCVLMGNFWNYKRKDYHMHSTRNLCMYMQAKPLPHVRKILIMSVLVFLSFPFGLRCLSGLTKQLN